MKDEGFDFQPSKTCKVMTGCGNAYITFDYNEKGNIDRICFQRNSKILCDPEIIEGLSRTVTFQSKREIKQLLIDLSRGEKNICRGYNAAVKGAEKMGLVFAYSCSDALAKALLKVSGNL